MKLYEHEALGAIFKKYKIPVPRYIFATDMNDAVNQFVEKEPGVVVKSMVLVGKRGKAGAVKVVSDKAKVPDVVRDLATREVYGEKSIGALVEEKLDIEKETVFRILKEHLNPDGAVVIWEPAWPQKIQDLREPRRRPLAVQNLGEHVQGNHLLRPEEIVEAFRTVGMKSEINLFAEGAEAVIVGYRSQ